VHRGAGLLTTPATAQPGPPGTLTIALKSVGATGVTYDVTWTPGTGATGYHLTAGFSDSGVKVDTLTTAPRLLGMVMPYHLSGLANTGFLCVQSQAGALTSVDSACAPLLVPAKGGIPPAPPTSMTVTMSWDEPSTNADGTPLTDLAMTTAWFKLGSGLDTRAVDVAASSLSGGTRMSATFTVPSASGPASFWVTATDTLGNVSLPTIPINLTLGPPAGAATMAVKMRKVP
jgi:hypothetical protein